MLESALYHGLESFIDYPSELTSVPGFHQNLKAIFIL
jgi:hypothetical protein